LAFLGVSFLFCFMDKAAEPKKRAKTYEPKLAINGSFDDVMKVFAAGL
jgi:hypothetical protein